MRREPRRLVPQSQSLEILLWHCCAKEDVDLWFVFPEAALELWWIIPVTTCRTVLPAHYLEDQGT